MGGKSARRKGHQWERELVKMFAQVFPGHPVFRGYQSRGGAEAADVVCPALWVEAKVGKLPNPRQALRQAAADRTAGRIPVAVIKDDRQRPFVCMYLDDFLEILGEWWEARKEIDAIPPPETTNVTRKGE